LALRVFRRPGLLAPEARAERAFDPGPRVTASVGEAADRVFLLERESGGQGSEPAAGPREGGPAGVRVVPWSDAAGELECAPADGAVRLLDEVAELLDPVLANEPVGVLGVTEQRGLEHAERRRLPGAARAVDGPREALAAGRVVVEGEHDRVEAQPSQARDQIRVEARTADGGHVRESPGPEVVHVDQSLDEQELPPLRHRQAQDVGEAVGLQAGAACPCEVEVAGGGLRVSERARPEGADPPALVAPGPTEPAGPAAVCEDARRCDVEIGVAGCCQGLPRRGHAGDDAQAGMVDRGSGEATCLQVGARPGADAPAQLRAAEREEALQEVEPGVSWSWPVDRRGLHARPLCDLTDDGRERFAPGNDAAVEVGGPEHGVAAVDEKAPGSGPVRDHPVGADAEGAVGHLVVRGDPAASVAAPAELGERLVEAFGEGREDYLGVEVAQVGHAGRVVHGDLDLCRMWASDVQQMTDSACGSTLVPCGARH